MKKKNTQAQTQTSLLLLMTKRTSHNTKLYLDFVGGMVEAVTFPNGDLLLLNEEGKLMGLPLNEKATALWRKHFTKETHLFGYDDFVVGPAIVIQKNALNTWAN